MNISFITPIIAKIEKTATYPTITKEMQTAASYAHLTLSFMIININIRANKTTICVMLFFLSISIILFIVSKSSVSVLSNYIHSFIPSNFSKFTPAKLLMKATMFIVTNLAMFFNILFSNLLYYLHIQISQCSICQLHQLSHQFQPGIREPFQLPLYCQFSSLRT